VADYYCLGDGYLCAALRYQTDPGLALSVFRNPSMVWMEVMVHLGFSSLCTKCCLHRRERVLLAPCSCATQLGERSFIFLAFLTHSGMRVMSFSAPDSVAP